MKILLFEREYQNQIFILFYYIIIRVKMGATQQHFSIGPALNLYVLRGLQTIFDDDNNVFCGVRIVGSLYFPLDFLLLLFQRLLTST